MVRTREDRRALRTTTWILFNQVREEEEEEEDRGSATDMK